MKNIFLMLTLSVSFSFAMEPDHEQSGLLHEQSGLLHEQSGLLHEQSGLLHEQSGLLHEQSGLLHEQSGLLEDFSRVSFVVEMEPDHPTASDKKNFIESDLKELNERSFPCDRRQIKTLLSNKNSKKASLEAIENEEPPLSDIGSEEASLEAIENEEPPLSDIGSEEASLEAIENEEPPLSDIGSKDAFLAHIGSEEDFLAYIGIDKVFLTEKDKMCKLIKGVVDKSPLNISISAKILDNLLYKFELYHAKNLEIACDVLKNADCALEEKCSFLDTQLNNANIINELFAKVLAGIATILTKQPLSVLYFVYGKKSTSSKCDFAEKYKYEYVLADVTQYYRYNVMLSYAEHIEKIFLIIKKKIQKTELGQSERGVNHAQRTTAQSQTISRIEDKPKKEKLRIISITNVIKEKQFEKNEEKKKIIINEALKRLKKKIDEYKSNNYFIIEDLEKKFRRSEGVAAPVFYKKDVFDYFKKKQCTVEEFEYFIYRLRKTFYETYLEICDSNVSLLELHLGKRHLKTVVDSMINCLADLCNYKPINWKHFEWYESAKTTHKELFNTHGSIRGIEESEIFLLGIYGVYEMQSIIKNDSRLNEESVLDKKLLEAQEDKTEVCNKTEEDFSA